jgi:hypothetical protein
VHRAPGIPHALISEGREKFRHNPGENASREGEGVFAFAVIARSEATKQSICPCLAMDCFASLAMTLKRLFEK